MGTVELLRAADAQRAATVRLVRSLGSDDFDREALPGWSVADVVAHLITIDRASVTGTILPALLGARSLRDFESWNDRAVAAWAARSPDDLADGLERWGRRASRLYRFGLPVLGRLRVPGPFGRQPLSLLVARTVYDEWVHGWDIVQALEHEQEDAGWPVLPEVAGVLADSVLGVLPALVLPRVGRTTGVVRLEILSSAGDPMPLRLWGIDFARRQYGVRVQHDPEATVRLPVSSLVLISSERVAPDEATGVELGGDADLGRDVVHALSPRTWAGPAQA